MIHEAIGKLAGGRSLTMEQDAAAMPYEDALPRLREPEGRALY